MEIKGKDIYIDKNVVLKLMDCNEDSFVYEEILENYEEMLKEINKLVKPRGLIGFAKAIDIIPEEKYSPNTFVAMVLYTIGNEISEYSTEMFEQGDYLKAMLVDAMADSCLFAMEKEWQYQLRIECQKRNFGIEKRLEAPRDIPMEAQKRVFEILDGKRVGLDISSGFMFSPVKTICQLFILTKDTCVNNVEHDCSKCGNLNCKLRSMK